MAGSHDKDIFDHPSHRALKPKEVHQISVATGKTLNHEITFNEVPGFSEWVQ